MQSWLSTPCVSIARSEYVLASSRDFVRIPGRMLVSFKGSLLHATHQLCMYRGLLFCTQCGFYAASIVRHLRWPCAVSRGHLVTPQGKRNLDRLAAGLCPIMARWPNEEQRRLIHLQLPASGLQPIRNERIDAVYHRVAGQAADARARL